MTKFKNKQFGIWMLIAVPVWTVGALIAEGVAPSPWWGYVAGTVVMMLLDPVADYLLNWKHAEEEVSELAQ
jgi:hypothetical protein